MSLSILAIQSHYGLSGVELTRAMQAALALYCPQPKVNAPNPLILAYDPQTRIFTVIGSSDISKESLQKILDDCIKTLKHKTLIARVLDEIDPEGNRWIRLIPAFDILSNIGVEPEKALDNPLHGRGLLEDDI